MVGGAQQGAVGRLKDNPRKLGKGRTRLVGSAPLTVNVLHRGGSIHQFLWRCSRIAGICEKGTERLEAMRNRFESSQVVRAGFESGRIAVTLRVGSCYCVSARAGGSGGQF